MQDVAASGSLHHKSPLDSLVRQSSRRAEHSPRLQPSASTGPGALGNHDRDPASPLLHTRFRTSASTARSSDNSLVGFQDDTATSGDMYSNRDDESMYSGVAGYSSAYGMPEFAYVVDSPTLPSSSTSPSPSTKPEHDRQSWGSHGSDGTVQEGTDGQSVTIRDTWQTTSSGNDPFTFQQYESPTTQVPKLVVSSPRSSVPDSIYYEPPPSQPVASHSSPIVRPSATQHSVYNFSRPIRAPTVYDEEMGSPESATSSIFRSSDTNVDVSSSSNLHPSPTTSDISASAVASDSSGHIRLPNSPPSPRPISRVSLYSTYSFYQFEDGSRTASPASPQFPAQQAPIPIPSYNDAKAAPTRSQNRNTPSPASSPSPSSSITPDEYLFLGIQHHEANRLAESATCFQRAATVDGGCGVGMLMWGLSLRHAWGTAKDEKTAFRWLRRAAEAAVGDLEAARDGVDQKAVKTELVLAIYEVGQCFFHGWGVKQDKKMAVSYFEVAARLGDGDAQQELGYCLANGKGCKKNLKEAAKWYRAAVDQGASTVGLAWIYKPKYA